MVIKGEKKLCVSLKYLRETLSFARINQNNSPVRNLGHVFVRNSRKLAWNFFLHKLLLPMQIHRIRVKRALTFPRSYSASPSETTQPKKCQLYITGFVFNRVPAPVAQNKLKFSLRKSLSREKNVYEENLPSATSVLQGYRESKLRQIVRLNFTNPQGCKNYPATVYRHVRF